jgi:hypothetical protein
MPRLLDAVRAWPSEAFARALKNEIESLPPGSLPLERGIACGGRVDDSRITATFLRSRDEGESIQADVGIFFEEVVGGCSCGDDPLAQNAYCELRVRIAKATGEAVFALLPD